MDEINHAITSLLLPAILLLASGALNKRRYHLYREEKPHIPSFWIHRHLNMSEFLPKILNFEEFCGKNLTKDKTEIAELFSRSHIRAFFSVPSV